MKSFLKTTFLIIGAALFISACEGQTDSLINDRLEENPPPEPVTADSGDASFSNYVAIGNSLTAGFMDGALYNLGQQNSIPALLADKLSLAGAPDEFNQPDINSELGYNQSATTQGGPILGRFKLDTQAQTPSPTLGGELPTAFGGDKSALDNFGVPGITVGQLLTPATGGPDTQSNPAFNPYYQRFASAPGSSTILQDAIATQPTFFTLWIGNNDVLGYAISGASNPAVLTSDSDFQTRFNGVVNSLMANTQAKGVVVNIPPFLGLPYFQAVPYNAIELGSTEAQQLDQTFDQQLNPVLDAVAANFSHTQAEMDARKVNYQQGANPILVNDPSLDDLENEFDQLESMGAITAQERAALVPYEQSRPLTVVNGKPELVTMPVASVLGQEANPSNQRPETIGVITPLGYQPPSVQEPLPCTQTAGDECYLTLSEQQQIEQKRGTFNGYIQNTVNSYGNRLALYNTNAPEGAFADIFGLAPGDSPGITVDGVDLAPDFSPGGVLSLDGIHPNPRGNGILTNEIINVIENKFNASIPKVDVLNLPSVQLCAGNCVSQQSGGS